MLFWMLLMAEGRQVQSDDGNAHAPHHRREQPVDKPHADELDEQSEHQVDGTRTHHAPHGHLDLLHAVHAEGIRRTCRIEHHAQRRDESEGGTQEHGALTACAQVEHQRAKAGGQQGHAHVKARQQRNEDGGTTHGESVLEAQRHRLARAHPLVRFCARKQEIVQFFEAVHSCMLRSARLCKAPRQEKPAAGPTLVYILYSTCRRFVNRKNEHKTKIFLKCAEKTEARTAGLRREKRNPYFFPVSFSYSFTYSPALWVQL